MTDRYDIAVVGGGGAGTMAYLRAVLNHDRAVLFLGDADSKRKGRATWVMEVDNMPGLHGTKRPITSTTRTTLAWLAEQEHLADVGEVVKARVDAITRRGDGAFSLSSSDRSGARTTEASFVVLATGIMDRQPVIGGSIQPILPFANRGDVMY